METIYFITSNKAKLEHLGSRLEKIGYNVEQLTADLHESQTFDIREIGKQKMEHARKLFPGKKLIIDDRGFFIPALNGFPGAFLKQTITTIGAIGFARLIREEEDKTAKFSSVLGYFDGEEEHYFVDEETGHLVNEPRGDNLHGWSEILKVYCGPKFSDRTLAELSDQEWEEYLSFVGKTDHFSMLVEYLSKQKQ